MTKEEAISIMQWYKVELATYDEKGKEAFDIAISALSDEQTEKKSGRYQCFHCLQNTVIWDADFDYSDFGLEGEGVVHVCHCTNCGAEIHVMSGGDEE